MQDFWSRISCLASHVLFHSLFFLFRKKSMVFILLFKKSIVPLYDLYTYYSQE